MKPIFAVLAVLVLLLAGCQGLTTPTNPAVVSATLTAEAQSTKTPEQRRLEETVWILQSINGVPALSDVEVTLEFSGDEVGGSTGCNVYGSPYKRNDSKLDIFEIFMTTQKCSPERIMQQEHLYEDVLWDVTTHEIEDGRLILKTGAGETLTFVPQP